MRPGVAASLFLLLLACCSKDEATARGIGAAGTDAVAVAVAVAGAGTDAGTAPGAAPAPLAAPVADPPLKAWMKANAARAVNARDFDRMAASLAKIATLAPPGYPYWASIARDGADAARAQDMDAVRGACRGCHTEYRDKYKRELRDRPIGT